MEGDVFGIAAQDIEAGRAIYYSPATGERPLADSYELTASGEAVEKGDAAMSLFWGAVTEEPLPKEKEEGKRAKLVRFGGGEGPKFDLFEAPDEQRAHILVARAVGPEYDPERMRTHVRPF